MPKLTKQDLHDAACYLERKGVGAARKDGRWKSRQESRLTNRLKRSFNVQMDWVVNEAAQLPAFKTKASREGIDALVEKIPGMDYLVSHVVAFARASHKKGAKRSHDDLDMGKYGVSFDLVNDNAVAYLNALRDLNLSNYRGSISQRTKDRIRDILTEAADSGQSYGDTAKQIRAEGKTGVFSRARGELIATTEIGNAYSVGNLQMVKEFEKSVPEIECEKLWIKRGNGTVDECDDNAAEGWVPTDHTFKSGDTEPLAHPRCECDLGYRTIKKGEG